MNDVIVSMYGGLGNQLFQYAAARSISLRCSQSIAVDLAWFEEVLSSTTTTQRKFSLDPFKLPIKLFSPVPKKKRIFNSYRLNRLYKLLTRFKNQDAIADFSEKGFNYDQRILDVKPPVRINGYWQSYKYFDHIADVIRTDINTIRNISPASIKLLEKIKATDSLCVHIRRGDYITNSSAAQVHGLCDMSYYANGIDIAASNLNNPHCFLFSDDPQWVSENFKCKFDRTVVDVNGPDTAHEDLWLMSACKRFVIANSSLSWWGAWLNDSPDKIVVAPKTWFKVSNMDTSDLIPPSWIRI